MGWPLWVPDHPRRNVILAVCATVLILGAGGAGIWLWIAKPWESAGEKFAATINCAVDNDEEQKACDSVRARFSAMVDGDKKRYADLTCSQAVPLNIDDMTPEIRAFQRAFQSGKMRVALTDIVIDGDRARLTLHMETASENNTSKFEWRKEDGTWKACSEELQ